jgi:hypothetical protein
MQINHTDHPYFNQYALHTFVMQLSVLCYTVFHFYVLIEHKNKNLFINNKIIHNNKNQLKFLIKTKIKLTFTEEIIFRVFLVELMSLFMSNDLIHPIWSIIYAAYYFKFYNCDIKISIAKSINIFIMSYFVLFNIPFLGSLLIHCYNELFSLALSNFLYKHFDVKIISKPNINKTNLNVDEPNLKSGFKPITEELASKDEVEALLSNKKMD